MATVANVTALLDYWEWGGWGISAEMWTVIMLTIATIIGGLMSFRHRDIAYAAVLIWAFIGIALKHSDNGIVATAAWVAAFVTAVLLIIGVLRGRRQNLQPALET